MATTFIYALCEPGTRTVRYVGMTGNLTRRMKEHLKDSIRLKTHLGYWLLSLVSRGVFPEVVKLRVVDSEFGPEAEVKYIRLARECGIKLVNATDGGEGVVNPSPETRAKRSAALTPEIREKMRAANLGTKNFFFGKKHTPEAQEKMKEANSGENNPMFGRRGWRHTEATKAKMRKPKSLAARAKMSASAYERTGDKNPFFGRKHTEESLVKMRKPKVKKPSE